MKIVCPACDAAYDVPAAVLAAPRKMRCARCGHDWVPSAEVPDSPPAMAEAPSAESPPLPASAPAPPPEPAPEPVLPPEPEPAPQVAAVAEAGDEAPEPVVLPSHEPPPLEELVFKPASFTNFEALPPVVEPLPDIGFEPVPVKFGNAPRAVEAPLLQPVPPRAPGDIDPVLTAMAQARPAGPSLALLALLWAASIAILSSGSCAGWVYRDTVMKAWPPSIRLYDALGAKIPGA